MSDDKNKSSGRAVRDSVAPRTQSVAPKTPSGGGAGASVKPITSEGSGSGNKPPASND